jgi:hypothetical protein
MEGGNCKVRINPIKNTLNIMVMEQNRPNEGSEEKRGLSCLKLDPQHVLVVAAAHLLSSDNCQRRKVPRVRRPVLQFSPHILEIVKALLAGEPLCRPYRTLRESAARLGIVAEIDPIRTGFEDDFMHSDDIALTERCDLKTFVPAACLANHLLNAYSRPGRRVLFMRMMSLKNLPRVLMLQRCRCRLRHIKKQIYPNRKIRRINEPRTSSLHQFPNLLDLAVPASRANHHILSAVHAGLNVRQNAVWPGEVDHHIDVAQLLRGESGTCDVLRGPDGLNAVSSLSPNIGNQRSSLASAKNQ